MIRYLKYNEIDTDKWDECIEKSFNGLVYAYSWYLDIVCVKWEGLVENDYDSVFPLTGNRKMGIDYLYQPFFTQQLGIFSRKHLTELKVKEFLEAIPQKYRFIEINLNAYNKLDCKNQKCISNKNHLLDLINSYENIAHDYSQNLKRNLKKSKDSGLSISMSIKPEDIITLFRNNRGSSIKKLKDSHYKTLNRLVYSAIYKGLAETWGVYDTRNILCAGAIFLISQKRVVFLFSGLNDTGKQNHAMPYLIDRFINKHSQRELTFDFEGSNDPDLARFYKSFGSKESSYLHFRYNRLNPLIYQMVKVVKWIKN